MIAGHEIPITGDITVGDARVTGSAPGATGWKPAAWFMSRFPPIECT